LISGKGKNLDAQKKKKEKEKKKRLWFANLLYHVNSPFQLFSKLLDGGMVILTSKQSRSVASRIGLFGRHSLFRQHQGQLGETRTKTGGEGRGTTNKLGVCMLMENTECILYTRRVRGERELKRESDVNEKQ
jgi:hypothetical protein